jgi:hypothetical protein
VGDDDDGNESGMLPLALIALIVGVVLLAIELVNFLQTQS